MHKFNHKVHIEYATDTDISGSPAYLKLIEDAVMLVLDFEKVDVPCVVCVLLTDNEGIRAYNKEYRGKDSATDVLSFPMFEFDGAGFDCIVDMEVDLDTKTLPLGDVIISTERINEQAKCFGHTQEREAALMMIHSTLHLLGYDHFDDDSEAQMKEIEQILLEKINYND